MNPVKSKDIAPFKQGLRDWLCQTAGAAAPSGGRKLRAANDRGGIIPLLNRRLARLHQI